MNNEILKIHNICFNDNKDSKYFEGLNIQKVYEYENIAYCILLDSIDVYEIFEIAVLPKYRKQGIATKLIEKLPNNKDIFLEVNEENIGAVNLYKKNGFKEISRRKAYYKDKTAIIMKKDKINENF
ncbi:GNAT family N-acetyltransferase [Oceanivirga salmonicida]|uniref:GNAT family N-acetyltransferase n=1 Tax=Oceanivirga salmonicida TaxID=1769291 RepID=UPI00082B0001|nr:GNAT family N-acetyltransferase [Oceanivirga salmonicida]